MKKVISVVIVLSILMSLLILPTKAAFYEAYNEDIDSLSMLDRFSLLPEQEIKADEITTRAVFCSMIANAAAIWESGNVTYKDVPEEHWAANAINGVTQARLLNGVGNGYFFPDEPIEVSDMLDAVSMIVYEGEYSKSMKTLYKLGITKGLETSKRYFTNEETATLILQMLKSSTYHVEEITAGYATKILSEETLLEQLHNIYERKGVLEYSAEKGTAVLNGVMYKYSYELSYVKFMVGKEVILYSLENDSDKRILYVEENGREASVIKNSSKNLLFSKKGVSYYNGNKTKNFRMTNNPLIYINGELCKSYSWDDLNCEDGWTELVDLNNDNVVERVLQYRPVTAVVSAVNSGKKLIEDFYQINNIDLSDDKVDYAIFDKDGSILKLSDIKKWDVLSIFADESKKHIIIIRSSDKVTGTVDSLDGSENLCSIDGEWYDIGNIYLNSSDYLIKLGFEGDFYIDFLGNIVAARVSVIERNYGILLANEKKGHSSPKLLVEVFSDDGQIKILESAGKKTIRINGEKKTIKDACDILDSSDKYQLVRYKTNEQGLLTELEFAQLSPKKEVAYDANRFTLNYKGSSKFTYDVIGPGYKTDADTKVFVVPSDRTDETSYQVGDKNLLPSDYTTVSIYDCAEDYIIKTAVVEYSQGKAAGDAMYGQNIAVFRKFAYGINRNGDTVPVIKYMQMGQEGSIIVKSDGLKSLESKVWSEYSGRSLESLKPGDIFQFTTDSFGELNEFHILHMASEAGNYKEVGTTTPTKDYMVSMLTTCYGKVLHKNADAVIVNGNGMNSEIDYSWNRIYRTSGVSVMIVEQSGTNVEVIKGGKEDIQIGDTVLVRVLNGAPKEIVIYRKDV